MFKVLKLKNYIIPFIFIVFTVGLVLFSNSNLVAAKKGLNLWANSVVPSLLPFFIATELLSSTNVVYILGKLFNPFMKPLFNVRGEGSFALLMGLISGYPTGAKIACSFRQNGICSKEECERLLSFTNNSGPLFIIGTVGISMFGNTTIGLLLFITHILACITVGIIFRFWKYRSSLNLVNNVSYPNHDLSRNIGLLDLGEIIGNSITNSISTILMIGGFVVLFSVVISILNVSHLLQLCGGIISPFLETLSIPQSLTVPILTCFLEITNGINAISNVHLKSISINIVLTSFFLGFGGLSVMLQVFSIIAKSDLSPKSYVIGKLLHGIISAFYTYLLIYFVPFFNFNI